MTNAHDDRTSASTEGKIAATSTAATTVDSGTNDASRFTPKSINKRLIVLCDGSPPFAGVIFNETANSP